MYRPFVVSHSVALSGLRPEIKLASVRWAFAHRYTLSPLRGYKGLYHPVESALFGAAIGGALFGSSGIASGDGEPKGRPMNLFDDIPSVLPDELTQLLIDRGGTCIERIVSHGHSSPDGFWYDQEEDEFVLLVTGSAKLRFADNESELFKMQPGDWIHIEAHRKHRVEWTTPEELTIWLAVFYKRELDGK
jgi:cupin 2 domain-containing protein